MEAIYADVMISMSDFKKPQPPFCVKPTTLPNAVAFSNFQNLSLRT
jgi:hypothetical protein